MDHPRCPTCGHRPWHARLRAAIMVSRAQWRVSSMRAQGYLPPEV